MSDSTISAQADKGETPSERVLKQPAANLQTEPTNRGQFRKGYDPRRHQLTQADRSKGFWSAIAVMGLSIGPKLHASGRWPSYKGRRAGR